MSKQTRLVSELAGEWMKSPTFRAEYDALEDEFALAAALIDARTQSDLTQEQIAERMHTSQAAVARLEGGRGNPSINTLKRYAAATGTKLRITFEPSPDTPTAAE